MQLSQEQQAAVDRVVALRAEGRSVISLAGPAGTGKTTAMKALVEALGDDAVVCAPTNKAAAVLISKGVDAGTIHSTFYTPREEREGGVKKLVFTPNCDVPDPVGLSFADTVVVDEASMLPTWMLRQLERMSNTLVLVGDPHQLPPVGDRTNPRGFFCTRDHDALLTQVHRQAEGSLVLQLATEIRQGRFPASLVRQTVPGMAFPEVVDTARPKVLAFTNRSRRLINDYYRTALGLRSPKHPLPVRGDVLVSNDNVSPAIINGTEMIVDAFAWDGRAPEAALTVTCNGAQHELRMSVQKFLADQPEHLLRGRYQDLAGTPRLDDEGASVSFGYCITAHKAQGSEWDNVLVLDEKEVLMKVDPTRETLRRWFYTAVTRARGRLMIADFRWFKETAKRVAQAA